MAWVPSPCCITLCFQNCFIMQTETLYPLSYKFPFSPPPTRGNHQFSVSEFAYMGILRKWNHIIFVLLCVAYFTYHDVFKVHPCCSLCISFIFLAE